MLDPGPQPADHQSDQYPTNCGHQEREHRGAGRERAGHGRRDGHPECGEPGGVVEQALALEDGHDLPRDAQAPGDGDGGDRIGRRDDGAQHERRAPGQPLNCDVADGSNSHHAGEDVADGQRADGADVGAHVGQGGLETGRVQERWEEQHEDKVGSQLDLG
jgi:hypothetical protein